MPPGATAERTRGCEEVMLERFDGGRFAAQADVLAVEEPLEIRLVYGAVEARETKSISVTMRTPGNDAELAAGFLMTEGVIRDEGEIAIVRCSMAEEEPPMQESAADAGIIFENLSASNVVTVELRPHVEVSTVTLQRNFYTTSSCGVCGKASLLALRTVCPPRRKNTFKVSAGVLSGLPERLRRSQGIFAQTGGLHAAALFDSAAEMDSMREDVGRHNAVDKLLGAALLEDRVPLRERLLLLSGRASFELLQKALMGGVPMVVAVGAPSSLAVKVAKEFDITLVGFLRGDRFNVYNGAERVTA